MCDEAPSSPHTLDSAENDQFWNIYDEVNEREQENQRKREHRKSTALSFESYVETHPEVKTMFDVAKKNNTFLLWPFYGGPEFVHYFSQGGDEDWICLSPNHKCIPIYFQPFQDDDLVHSYSTAYGTVIVKTHS